MMHDTDEVICIYQPYKKTKLTDSGFRNTSSSILVSESASRAAVKLPIFPAPARSYNYRAANR